MGVTYIILPKKLGEKLRARAEERGYLPEELGVELLRKSLNEDLDPEDLAEHYQALSEKYLRDAKEVLNKGDLVQASEKLWGATALAVKMVAAKRGLKLEKHGALWQFIDRLSRETGDEELITLFGEANALHRNFYEDEMTQKAVEVIGKNTEKLIEKLKQVK
ncbi:MAG: PaREP1 family protein [archaeon]|nr:PaREP1 family protein [archaeon]